MFMWVPRSSTNGEIMSKQICKNCGHAVYSVFPFHDHPSDWVHENHFSSQEWYKCKCGCENPEPAVIK